MYPNEKSSQERDAANQNGKGVRESIQGAINQAADSAKPAIDRLANGVNEGIDKAGAKIEEVSGALTERRQQAGEAYQRFAETSREYVRSSPVASLLMALAAGYGLSKLFRSRDQERD